MNVSISQQSYGKSNVRLTHVSRQADRHELIQLAAQIMLEGDFDSVYTDADNHNVIPTDTMKNTVYAVAKKYGVGNIEMFAQQLADNFITKFEHDDKVHVNIRQQQWHRIDLNGRQHGHAFVGGGTEENECRVEAAREHVALTSGLAGLQVLKTTESGFSGFLKDEFTSLTETDDRIFATTISASWPCGSLNHDWTSTRRSVRDLMLDVFAHNYSPSVQKTLHEMAELVLASCPEIDEISIQMPNQHHLLVDLSAFNLTNEHEVFVPTTEPFGVISATIKRVGKTN